MSRKFSELTKDWPQERKDRVAAMVKQHYKEATGLAKDE